MLKGQRSALVIGDDNRSFLACVQSLAAAGVAVDVIPFNWRAPALTSKAIRRVFKLARPSEDVRTWANAVASISREMGYALVLPCDERSLLPLVAYRDKFQPDVLAWPGEKALELTLDKARFFNFARSVGVPVADSRLLEEGDTVESLIEDLGLPIVARQTASYSLRRLNNRGQTEILRTRSDVQAFLAEKAGAHRWLFSSYFPVGDNAQAQGVGISVLADRGEVVLGFQHARLTEPDSGGGSSSRVSEALDREHFKHVRNMVAACQLNGLAMFEFRRDIATGDTILIELNARPWGSLPLAIRAGADFPAALFALKVDGERPQSTAYREGVIARNLVNNVYDLWLRNRKPLPSKIMETAGIVTSVARAITNPDHPTIAFDGLRPGDYKPVLNEITALPKSVITRRQWALQGKPERRKAQLKNR